MRSEPEVSDDLRHAGAIIDLGEVRRRRQVEERAPDRLYLFALIAVAWLSWTWWLTVLVTLPPSRLLSFLAFFVPLTLALTATFGLVAYVVDWRLDIPPSLPRALRRGFSVALVVVLNLAFLAGHKWSVVVLFVTIAAAIGVELAVRRRAILESEQSWPERKLTG